MDNLRSSQVNPDTSAPAEAAHWHARADELAAWAWDRLVNRTDVWGGYVPLEKRGQEYTRRDGTRDKLGSTLTRPAKAQRGKVFLTPDVLVRHFRARGPLGVVGLHTTSPENTSKAGTVEVDWHGPASYPPEVNFAAARGWYDCLLGRGFHPLLWDSNCAGGFHLDVLLAQPVPTRLLFYFLRHLVTDHARYGFSEPPECFPKQPEIRPGQYGNFARLIGRHHTSDHWARVWDGGRWLVGDQAIDHVLTLGGDDLELIPADIEWQVRIGAYLATLPNLGEGQGRDDVAFNFLAFMVRDLKLNDDYALGWANRWDAGNRPPKGEQCLREILRNVHAYGQRPYGSGLTNGTAAQSPAPAAPAARKGQEIIRDYLWGRLQPSHKEGTAVWSTALDQLVKPSDARYYCDDELMRLLDGASDRPPGRSDTEARNLLKPFCDRWRDPAWADILRMLKAEEDSDEVPDGARERFRRWVAAALNHQETYDTPDKSERSKDPKDRDPTLRHQERRTLLSWCRLFADTLKGNWAPIRSLPLWSKHDGQKRLRIALRVELFDTAGPPQLRGMPRKVFSSRCRRYGVSTGEAAKPCGEWAVELDPEFIAGLREGPDGCRVDEDQETPARTRGANAPTSTEGEMSDGATT